MTTDKPEPLTVGASLIFLGMQAAIFKATKSADLNQLGKTLEEIAALIRSLDERARMAEETLEHSHLGGHVRVCSQPACRAAIIRADDGSRNCAAGHPARWVDIAELDEAKERARRAEAQVKQQAEEIKELKNKLDDADRYIEMKGVAKR